MFKYHRNNTIHNNIYLPQSIRSNTVLNRNSSKANLSKFLKDTSSYRNSTINRLDEIKTLDKIRQNRKINSRLSAIGNLQNVKSNNNINNTKISLPKPKQYSKFKENINNSVQTKVIRDEQELATLLNKINQAQIDDFKKNDPLAQKQTKIIDNPQQIQSLLNNINNNQFQNNNISNLQIEQTHEQIKQEQQKQKVLKYVISADQLINKMQFIVQNIQCNIYMNTQYNYYKLVQFVYNLYEQYGDNPMSLMIICKGFSQFNKKQMIKLPQDKIADIIQYIIEQIKQ